MWFAGFLPTKNSKSLGFPRPPTSRPKEIWFLGESFHGGKTHTNSGSLGEKNGRRKDIYIYISRKFGTWMNLFQVSELEEKRCGNISFVFFVVLKHVFLCIRFPNDCSEMMGCFEEKKFRNITCVL